MKMSHRIIHFQTCFEIKMVRKHLSKRNCQYWHIKEALNICVSFALALRSPFLRDLWDQQCSHISGSLPTKPAGSNPALRFLFHGTQVHLNLCWENTDVWKKQNLQLNTKLSGDKAEKINCKWVKIAWMILY